MSGRMRGGGVGVGARGNSGGKGVSARGNSGGVSVSARGNSGGAQLILGSRRDSRDRDHCVGDLRQSGCQGQEPEEDVGVLHGC